MAAVSPSLFCWAVWVCVFTAGTSASTGSVRYEWLPEMDDAVGVGTSAYQQTVASDSVAFCSIVCARHPSCEAFTFHRDSVGVGWCYLYTGTRPTQTASLPGARTVGRSCGQCSPPWTRVSCSACFLLSQDTATFQGAIQRCGEFGGQLMVLDTPARMAAFSEMVQGRQWWGYVGGYLNASSQTWLWLPAQTPVDFYMASVMDGGECLLVDYNAQVSDAPCGMSLRYACELPLPDACPSG